jgi:hypothetical protein
MLWAREGASRSSGRRQGRRYRNRVDSRGRYRCIFIAPTMLADSGHVACSTVYEAWIRLLGASWTFVLGLVCRCPCSFRGLLLALQFTLRRDPFCLQRS